MKNSSKERWIRKFTSWWERVHPGPVISCALTWTLSFELEGIPMLITHPLFNSLFLVPNRSLRLSKHETSLFVCVFLMEVFKFRSIRLLGVGADQIVRVLPYWISLKNQNLRIVSSKCSLHHCDRQWSWVNSETVFRKVCNTYFDFLIF